MLVSKDLLEVRLNMCLTLSAVEILRCGASRMKSEEWTPAAEEVDEEEVEEE